MSLSKRTLVKMALAMIAVTMCVVVFTVVPSFRAGLLDVINRTGNAFLNREPSTFRTETGLWLKGYLGAFFNFRWFGYVNLLMIPLGVYYICTCRRRPRWQNALASVYVLSLLLIGFRGYHNERYILTMFPFSVTAVVFLGWEAGRNRIGRVLVLLVVGVLALLGFREQWDAYRAHTREKLLMAEWRALPESIIGFFNDGTKYDGRRVVVCKQPFFYYYCSGNALDYQDRLLRPLLYDLKKLNSHKRARMLQEHNIGYFLSSRTVDDWLPGTGLRIIPVMESNICDLVIDDLGYRLYEVRSPDLIPDEEAIRRALKEKDRVFSERGVLGTCLVVFDSLSNRVFADFGPDNVPEAWRIEAHGTPPVSSVEPKGFAGKRCVRLKGDDFMLTQDVDNVEEFCGGKVTVFAWLKTSVPGKYSVGVDDGISQTFSEKHPGDGRWHVSRLVHRVDPAAKRLTVVAVEADATGEKDDEVCVDSVMAIRGEYENLDDALAEAR